jgi:hypothetical protein
MNTPSATRIGSRLSMTSCDMAYVIVRNGACRVPSLVSRPVVAT